MNTLQGRKVAITGASRGIGAAAARAFSQAGAVVALMARDSAAIADLAREIGGGAVALPVDVFDGAAVHAAMAEADARLGGLDVLVNNAGMIEPIAGLSEVDPEAWSKSIDVNLKGVFHGLRAVLPGMLARGRGTILTVSSGAAHNPYEGWSAYCAGKAGAAMLMRSLHLEHHAQGIRAIGLSPGTVATQMQVTIRASGINPVSRLDPSVHIPPEWPARALVWLAGPGGDAHVGREVSLRDEAIRRAVGLVP